jgi:MFS family permease
MAAGKQSTAVIETHNLRERRFHSIRGALGKRDFRLFWIGESTSLVGTSVSSVVIPLVGVKVLHAGTFAVALLTGATWLPWLVFGLIAGAWVDRFRKRTLMISCDLIALALFASIAISAWSGILTVAQLLVTSLLAGLVSVFFKAAYQAYIPQLLQKDELVDGNAKLQTSASFATVSGPGIGGAIAQLLGISVGVLLNAVSFAVSAICLLVTSPLVPEEKTSRPRRELGKEIAEGLTFLRHDPYLLPLAVFTSTLSLGVYGTDSLFVIFFVRTLGASSSATGLIMGLVNAGGLFGAATSARLVQKYGSARAMLICRVLLIFALLFPLTTRGIGLVFSIGLFMMTLGIISGNVISASFRQARCPAQIIGRVSATYYTMTYSSLALGTVLGGTLGTFIGVRPALWVTCGIVAGSSLILYFSPIRHLRDLPDAAVLDNV